MTDRWEFYFCHVNQALASILVNLGFRTEAPQASYPKLCWVWVDMHEPLANGLSSSTEVGTLEQIEDALVPACTDKTDARFVGRITTSRRREFYFYIPADAALKEVFAIAMQNFPKYTYEAGERTDPQWQQYLKVLYPSPRDQQRIQNRHVVDNLKQHGDALLEAREVRHWIYFRTDEGRQFFAERVRQNGFQIVAESLQEKRPAFPYSLIIMRDDNVDLDSANQVVLDLFELANEMDGDYDGWETQVN